MYKTIERAFEKAKELKVETGTVGDINISSIADTLIRDCGRFAERYASDMLITYQHIQERTGAKYYENHIVTEPEEQIYVFGIRESGVDHDAFLIRRIMETASGNIFDSYVHPKYVYRRIHAVKVIVSPPDYGSRPACTVILKDITDEIIRVEPEDVIAVTGENVHGKRQSTEE